VGKAAALVHHYSEWLRDFRPAPILVQMLGENWKDDSLHVVEKVDQIFARLQEKMSEHAEQECMSPRYKEDPSRNLALRGHRNCNHCLERARNKITPKDRGSREDVMAAKYVAAAKDVMVRGASDTNLSQTDTRYLLEE
jgi:hypothetical protein